MAEAAADAVFIVPNVVSCVLVLCLSFCVLLTFSPVLGSTLRGSRASVK